MPCLVPFNNRNLDVSFFVFKSVGVIVEDLVEALKWVSFSSEEHGCAYSSILRSIHGNLIIWYGAWIKRSDEKRELLIKTLMSTIANLSNLAILLDYGFFEAYAGESKDGHPNAKFSTGDTVSMTAVLPRSAGNLSDLSYACLALLKSCFLKMEGVSAVVCFKNEERPRVASLHVWKSLQSCYTWLLNSDHRKTIAPYVKHLSARLEYDVFRVVYVSNDDIINIRILPQQTLGPREEGEDKSVCR